MNQDVINKVEQIFYETNFANKFAWPGLFKAQAALLELKTDKFQKWFDNELKLPLVKNVHMNAVNLETDKEEIYDYLDFQDKSPGICISRSISIPGFIDNRPHVDGGVSQNPCISQWEMEELPIFVSQLMLPYRTTPKSRIETLFYAWEHKAFQCYQLQRKNFPKDIRTIYPMISDISSADFALSKEKKKEMVNVAYHETALQLEHIYKFKPGQPRMEIALGLSGGGIRSGAHIGVIKALMEYNIHPVKYSGTSGGAAFAYLFAGFEELLKSK